MPEWAIAVLQISANSSAGVDYSPWRPDVVELTVTVVRKRWGNAGFSLTIIWT